MIAPSRALVTGTAESPIGTNLLSAFSVHAGMCVCVYCEECPLWGGCKGKPTGERANCEGPPISDTMICPPPACRRFGPSGLAQTVCRALGSGSAEPMIQSVGNLGMDTWCLRKKTKSKTLRSPGPAEPSAKWLSVSFDFFRSPQVLMVLKGQRPSVGWIFQ